MGIPTRFELNGASEYTLWNGQTGFAGQTARPRMPILRAPEANQAVAVTWDKKTKAFTSVYFTLLQEGDEKIADDTQTGNRIAGKYKGADLFIIALPGKKLPVDLRDKLTEWVNAKYLLDNEGSQAAQKRRDRSITIGALTLEVEKLFGKWEVSPKPAVAREAERQTPPADEATRQPVRQDRPTTILGGAAQEVGHRDEGAQAPDDHHDDALDNLVPVSDDLETRIFRGTVLRISNEDARFRHIRPDRTIPELDGKDAFVHFNQVPEAEDFREGDRVEFQLEISPSGRIQVSNAARAGSLRPLQIDAGDQQDQRELPRVADADLRNEDFAQREDVRPQRRDKIIIKDGIISTPYWGDVIAPGAWKKVRNDRDPG